MDQKQLNVTEKEIGETSKPKWKRIVKNATKRELNKHYKMRENQKQIS